MLILLWNSVLIELRYTRIRCCLRSRNILHLQWKAIAPFWKSFITPFGKRKCAVVGITSAVNALIDRGETGTAGALYRMARESGLPENVYIEKRLL